MVTPLVEMKDVSISFGGVKAVDHVSIDLYDVIIFTFYLRIFFPEEKV